MQLESMICPKFSHRIVYEHSFLEVDLSSSKEQYDTRQRVPGTQEYHAIRVTELLLLYQLPAVRRVTHAAEAERPVFRVQLKRSGLDAPTLRDQAPR